MWQATTQVSQVVKHFLHRCASLPAPHSKHIWTQGLWQDMYPLAGVSDCFSSPLPVPFVCIDWASSVSLLHYPSWLSSVQASCTWLWAGECLPP